MAGFILGKDAKLKYKAGGVGASPTTGFTPLDNCRDLTLNLEKGEADVTTRGSGGWRQTAPTLKDGSVDFQMIWDPTDPGFGVLLDSYLTDGIVGFQVLDKEPPGAQGLVGDFAVTNFSRSEPLEEAQTADVTIKLTRSDFTPDWIEL